MKTFLQKIEPVLLEKILLIILSGSFLTFSLYVYQAYNIEGGYSDSGHSLLFRAICFGVLTSISFLLNEYLLHKIIPVKYILSWRIWELIMGGTVTFLLFNYFWNWQEWFYRSYFQLLLEYSAIIIFPILISHFIKKYVIQLRYIQKGKDEHSPIKNNQKITFISTNQKQKLTLQLEDFLYATTADNYIEIYYIEGKVIKKSLLRMPMKDLENHFKNYPFERCHRSYFVNTTNIRQVKRSNQKLEIWLNHLDYSLPVSKKYQTLPIWSGY